MKRAAGVLMPVFSLPSKYGIGCFSKEAYEFIEQLNRAGQSYWQILPLGPTGAGDSPYQSESTFAGNPFFIDLEDLIDRGLLTIKDCRVLCNVSSHSYVDYHSISNMRHDILKKAYGRFVPDIDFLEFKDKNGWWLDDYALFMALKKAGGRKCWIEWEKDIRLRLPESISKYTVLLKDDIEYYKWLQFIFFDQWKKLKKFAGEHQIKIIGDMPIYVAYDSADCWANTRYFDLDKNMRPRNVSGCPPDYFAPTGQLWGNPVYNWNSIRRHGYDWWIRRISFGFELYDIIRIDHFRGFDEYYSVPAGSETAEHGVWEKGPGYNFFRKMKTAIGDRSFIAEDLGMLTDSVHELVRKTGYPGMKVLEFAFGANDTNDYLPHHYDRNCVVYTGTHDNDTVRGWFRTVNDTDRRFAATYLGCPFTEEHVVSELIMLAQRSQADTCIIPMQDWLGLGSEARINTPGTIVDNWHWRMAPDAFSDELARQMKEIAEICSRTGGSVEE